MTRTKVVPTVFNTNSHHCGAEDSPPTETSETNSGSPPEEDEGVAGTLAAEDEGVGAEDEGVGAVLSAGDEGVAAGLGLVGDDEGTLTLAEGEGDHAVVLHPTWACSQLFPPHP